MERQELLIRACIALVIFLIVVLLGIHAMNCYISQLQATLIEKENQIQNLEQQNTEMQEIVDEVKDAESFIRLVNPGISISEAQTLAIRQVAKARKYGIPRELVALRDWSEANLRWLSRNQRGPCGEHSTAQVWKPTFRYLRPNGDYNDMDQVYDAGTQYLADCYRTALRWMPNASEKEVVRLTLAFYNAGMRHKPQVALYRARAHVRRVDGILAKAERLGVAV